ncbi:MAG: glycoside hydrolase family 3 [Actinomycetota bacterium]|nr:glycoside hydrolase family 3 [Actinomycetota bacterium]
MTARAELRRLVNGVLLPGFIGTEPPSWLARAAADGLAGVAYFGHNVVDRAQVSELSNALHALGDGFLVASDEEGGDVTRLEARQGSSYPGNAALGRLDDTPTTAAVARCIARDARLAGIDIVLAPTADVSSNPDNPVIGVRSFGRDTELVARHTGAFVTGLQNAGVAGCAKHFPGHGDTAVDSHVGLPVIEADLATLRRRDLPPFAAAIEAGVRCVLTAHIRFPSLDHRPATLSPVVLGLLRDELAFDGVIITDALDMHAVSRTVGMGPGAVEALSAGADLLCISNPRDDEAEFELVCSAVIDAVLEGSLARRRVEEARERVRALAAWVCEARSTPLPDPEPDVGLEVARRALSVTGSVRLRGTPHVLDIRTHVNQAAGRHGPRLHEELVRRAPATTSSKVRSDGRDEAASTIVAQAQTTSRPVVVLVDEPHRDPAQAALLAAVTSARPDVVVVSSGWPDERSALGDNVVVMFGAGRVNAQAAAEVLLG